jgi:acyl-coenzyme A synthetase/AMP-(fatty) acid ligase
MWENIIDWQARLWPERAAIQTDDGVVTYGMFARDIALMTGALERETLPSGVVLIATPQPAMQWLLIFALERLGHPTVYDLDRVEETAKLVRPAVVIAASETPGDFDGVRVLRLTPEWRRWAFAQAPSPRLTTPQADDLVRIILSSGTTGQRKQVPISRGVMDSRLCRPQMFSGQEPRRTLSAMGMDTIGGFQQPLKSWVHGGTAVMPKDFTKRLFQRSDRPTEMSISPARLQALLPLMAGPYSEADPIKIRVAGSATPPTLIKAVAAQPGMEMFVSYGSTESGTIAWGPSTLALRRPGAVGYLTPWMQVEIIDQEGRALPVGSSGVIRVRGPDVAPRYIGKGAGSDAFRDGWFYPNDIGHLDNDGVLVIDGRSDDVINIGGLKLSSARVEETLLACEGVTDAAVTAFPMSNGGWAMHAAIVTQKGYEADAVKKAVMEVHNVEVRPVTLEAIPRNGMGKIIREDVRQAILAKSAGG